MAFFVESREALSEATSGRCSVTVLTRYSHMVYLTGYQSYDVIDGGILRSELQGQKTAKISSVFPSGPTTCKWQVVWIASGEGQRKTVHVALILKSTSLMSRPHINATYDIKFLDFATPVKYRHTFVVGVPSPPCVLASEGASTMHVKITAEVETRNIKPENLLYSSTGATAGCFLQSLDNERFSDVTIRVNPDEKQVPSIRYLPPMKIPAHRIVLATKSPKFAEMLENTQESEPSIDIEDFEPDTVQAMISFLYQGYKSFRPRLTSSLALKLWKLSRKYEIGELQTMCEGYLFSKMEIGEAEEWLLSAENRDTQEKIIDYLFDRYHFKDYTEVFERIANDRPDVTASLFKIIPSVIASLHKNGSLNQRNVEPPQLRKH